MPPTLDRRRTEHVWEAGTHHGLHRRNFARAEHARQHQHVSSCAAASLAQRTAFAGAAAAPDRADSLEAVQQPAGLSFRPASFGFFSRIRPPLPPGSAPNVHYQRFSPLARRHGHRHRRADGTTAQPESLEPHRAVDARERQQKNGWRAQWGPGTRPGEAASTADVSDDNSGRRHPAAVRHRAGQVKHRCDGRARQNVDAVPLRRHS